MPKSRSISRPSRSFLRGAASSGRTVLAVGLDVENVARIPSRSWARSAGSIDWPWRSLERVESQPAKTRHAATTRAGRDESEPFMGLDHHVTQGAGSYGPGPGVHVREVRVAQTAGDGYRAEDARFATIGLGGFPGVSASVGDRPQPMSKRPDQ